MANALNYWFSQPRETDALTTCSKCSSTSCPDSQKLGFCLTFKLNKTYQRITGNIADLERQEAKRTQVWVNLEQSISGGAE